MKKSILFFLVICLSQIGIAQFGTIDTTFQLGSGANRPVKCSALQQDGKILLGGDFTSFSGSSYNKIVRLNEDGSIDFNFNIGIGADSSINTIAIQPNGKIIIAGEFTNFKGITHKHIARLNNDGSIDPSFNSGTGLGNTPYLNSIEDCALQPDGKILICGSFKVYNGVSINCIARLNSDGSLDQNFNSPPGPSVIIANPKLFKVRLQNDGKVLIGGYMESYNGPGLSCKGITRLMPQDASGDTTFKPTTLQGQFGSYITIQSDGSIVAGTAFDIQRLYPNGSKDLTFNIGVGPDDIIRDIYSQIDGKILVVGDFANFSGTARNRVLRLNYDGSIDNTFNPGLGANNPIFTILPLPNGKYILGGAFHTFGGYSRFGVVRINGFIPNEIHENYTSQFSIYPNPLENHLCISFPSPNNSESEVIILNKLGQIVQKEMLAANQELKTINVESLEKGVFFVQIKTSNTLSVRKFIKN